MAYVFTYGTLMKNRGNHHYLAKAKFVSDAILEDYAIGDCGGGAFPVIIPQKGGKVLGEVYEVTPEIEKNMDYLEGINPQRPQNGLYVKKNRKPYLVDSYGDGEGYGEGREVEAIVYTGEDGARSGQLICNIREGEPRKWERKRPEEVAIEFDDDDDFEIEEEDEEEDEFAGLDEEDDQNAENV